LISDQEEEEASQAQSGVHVLQLPAARSNGSQVRVSSLSLSLSPF
jgi:hypothetical protein